MCIRSIEYLPPERKVFKKIPLTSLLTALNTKSGKRIARSDRTDTVKGFKRKVDVYTDTKITV